MMTINESNMNVIAIKPANIDFLGNTYQSNKPVKASNAAVATPEISQVTTQQIDAAQAVTPPAELSPVPTPPAPVAQTNAEVLASEFAVPATEPEIVAPAAPIINDFPASPANLDENKLSSAGAISLEIINEITELQRRLDAIGEKVMQLSNDSVVKADEVNPQTINPVVSEMTPEPQVNKETEIIPFVPAGENIFDQPNNISGPSLAA